ncbi:HU family DNA-binding protein [Alphaproteobacteria bacterium]|nr:HU family DNA-binding protein [Alphaproteobacteria bacterium]
MRDKIKREDIAKVISSEFGIPYTLAYSKIDKILSQWSNAIVNSNLSIASIGTFKIINKKLRIGRNPKSKVEHIIKPRNTVTFKKSKKLQIK